MISIHVGNGCKDRLVDECILHFKVFASQIEGEEERCFLGRVRVELTQVFES